MINLILYGAITFGILSLGVPICSLLIKNKTIKNELLSVSSCILCSLSLFLIVLYCYFLVKNNDIATLEDTMYGLYFISAVILLGTLFSNVMVFLTNKRKCQ